MGEDRATLEEVHEPFVAVTALVDPEMLIEIEVDAVVTGLEGPGAS